MQPTPALLSFDSPVDLYFMGYRPLVAKGLIRLLTPSPSPLSPSLQLSAYALLYSSVSF